MLNYKKVKTKTLQTFLFIFISYHTLGFIKIFSPFYLYDGSFNETFWYFKDIVVSLCIYLGIFIYFILGIHNHFKGSKTISDDAISHFIVIGSMLSAAYLCLSGAIPFNLNADSLENAHLYDVLFDYRFYIIDVIVFVAFAFIVKKYSLLKTFGYIVLFKVLTLLAMYLNLVSAVHNAYDPIWKTENNFLSPSLFCKNQYVHTESYILIKFSDCPYLDLSEKEKYIKMAEQGSYLSLLKVNKDPEITLAEKAHITKRYYFSNSYLDNQSWLENNIPSLYEKTSLAMSKKVYMEYKTRNLRLVNAILNNDTAYIDRLRERPATDTFSLLESSARNK